MKKLRMLLVCGPVFLAGCPLQVETNQEACERMVEYFIDCLSSDEGDPGEFFAELCVNVPGEEECNFPALTDCIIENTTCDTLLTADLPASCQEIAAECVPIDDVTSDGP
jgi:hypothetical protein